MAHVGYRNQSVSIPGGIGIKDKIIDVSFRNKDALAITDGVEGVNVKQIPRGRRGKIFPVVMACVVAFMLVAAAGAMMWAPLPRTHLMVSLVADVTSWLPAAETGAGPHG